MLENYRLQLIINDVEVNIKTLSRSMTDFSQSWKITIRNTGMSVGYWANEDAKIQYKENDESSWQNIFVGKVSSSGATRSRGYVTDDYLSLELIDLAKAKLTKIKPTKQTLANFYISNIYEEETSLIHYLANLAGITRVNADRIMDILTIVNIGDDSIWSELQKIAETYCLNLYFDNIGTLCLKDAYVDSETNAKYIIGNNSDNPILGKINETFAPVEGNSFTCTFNEYEKQEEQIIFKSFENYVESTDLINIDILPNTTWPKEGVTNLNYKSIKTNCEFPLAIDVKTPTIGPNDSYDISYSGGNLELKSFNGSTDDTEDNPSSAQIILENTGTTTCSINNFTITGTPFIHKSENNVKKEIQDLLEIDKISKTINAKFASNVEAVQEALEKYLKLNQNRTREFSFKTSFIPFLERNDVVILDLDNENIKCTVESFENNQKGQRINTLNTSIKLKEIKVFSPTTFSKTSNTPINPINIVGNKGETGPKGDDAISIQIFSTNGDKFRDGTASTTLKCFVFQGDDNITNSISEESFNWTRISSSTNYLDDDRWNTSSKAIGKKTIEILPEDTIGRTNFSCEVEI
jgi:hypothetical protein